jgi:ESS family glutamate:Na+ symporter
LALSFDSIQTLAIAIAVLFIGSAVVRRVPFLRESNIPIPVAGGIVLAVASAALYVAAGIELTFDPAPRAPLMLAFFATIGLTADLRELKRGGPQLALFAALCLAFLTLQNTIGFLTARALDLHPLVGLLGSSITLSGGHGTGAAYAERFADVQNIAGSMELAMACATFGLIIGGVVGGPVAGRLIRRNDLESQGHDVDPVSSHEAELAETPMTGETLLKALFLLLGCVIAGDALGRALSHLPFTLPGFVWALFVGVIVRNVRGFVPRLALHDPTVEVLGSLSLGLFLAMALMSLQLWALMDLAGPLAVMLAAQTTGMVLFATFVTFRVMGGRYDGAVIAGGHCGFGMGATPTAIANMEAVAERYGPSPQAFVLVPLIGAFFIDFANALVIQGFLALPVFGL